MAINYFLKKEDGDYLLLETGDNIILEQGLEAFFIVTDDAVGADVVGITDASNLVSDVGSVVELLFVEVSLPAITDTATISEEVISAPLIIVTDTATVDDTDADLIIGPIIEITETATGDDTIIRPLEDTATATDTITVTVDVTIADTGTGVETLALTGPAVPPPDAPAVGGVDTDKRIVLRLLYGNDKRNPIRTLDIAEAMPAGSIMLRATSGSFSPKAGEPNELWSGESIRFDGQDKLGESRKHSELQITTVLKSDSQAALSYFMRKILRFFTEARHQQITGQTEAVWLEYGWSDGLNNLARPTFGQLRYYWEVLSAQAPEWPDDLHDEMDSTAQGVISGVVLHITGSPVPEGLMQECAVGRGDVEVVAKGVRVPATSLSLLYWQNYPISGLTGNFVVTGWATVDSSWASGEKVIFDYWVSAADRLTISYDASNTRWKITKIVSGTTYTANSAADSVAVGDDNHLIAVQDDTTLHLYVNGLPAASVAAANSIAEGGWIGLGGPIVGSAVGSGVIVDGWRIMPDDATADEATMIFDAELPIKQDGGSVGTPPFLLTDAGIFENGLDATHENYGIIGGVTGDLDAFLRLQITPSFADNTGFWLGIRARDEIDNLEDFVLSEVAYSVVTSDAGSNNGSYSLITHASPNTLDYSPGVQAFDIKTLYGRYKLLARIRVGSSGTAIAGWNFASSGGIYNNNPLISITNTAFKLLSFGDVFINSEASLPINNVNVRFTITGPTVIGIDYVFLMPNAIQLTHNGATSIPLLIVENGLAYSYEDAGAIGPIDYLECTGELRAVPNKYNYLFLWQMNNLGDTVRGHTATVKAFVTPRFELPGGMIA